MRAGASKAAGPRETPAVQAFCIVNPLQAPSVAFITNYMSAGA